MYVGIIGCTLWFERPEGRFAFIDLEGAQLMRQEAAGPGRRSGRIACPNCSQMLADLGVQRHQVPPVNGQNFSQPDRGWASQHQGPVVHLGFR
ncbi:hypothetical protein BE21_43770 [Sorangium cellulosum]|uniref:Uncharacterized protein n=1 Tax=Sorangium cellulosum TaxID=56 RepID=A0A150TJV3_SORCE|nr:hypothetical protein BE21_43770 [Sorangium cellulosum]